MVCNNATYLCELYDDLLPDVEEGELAWAPLFCPAKRTIDKGKCSELAYATLVKRGMFRFAAGADLVPLGIMEMFVLFGIKQWAQSRLQPVGIEQPWGF